MSAASMHPVQLPWFAAGTLEAAEAAEIARHVEECAECRAELESLRSMTHTLRALRPADHVAAEQLVVYRQRNSSLSPDERRGIARHVDACPSCREDLEALGRAEESLRATGRRPLLAAAASLLVVALGGWQIASRRSPAPRNLAQVTLAPMLREVTAKSIPAGPCEIRFLLPSQAENGIYVVRLEVPDAPPRILGTAPSRDQWVVLRVPQGFAPGHHLLSLTPQGGNLAARHPYSIDVEASP